MSKKERISEVERVKSFLRAKPGYLKKSAWIVAVMLKTTESVVKKAKKALKTPPDRKYDVEWVSFEKPKLVKKDKSWAKSAIDKYAFKAPRAFNLDNVLAISDQHEPFCKEGYLEHCIRIRDKYNCGTIILIGDEVDLCGVSQWEKDPDGFSAGTEASLAQEKMKEWYKAFPQAYVCIGNHTARPFRMAKQHGIPKKFIKSYEEAWEAPESWKWAENWEFNGVLYTHGTGFSGPNAAIRIATRHRQNTVIGHIHSEAGIQYSASKVDLVWGMQLGGALDDKAYAAFYAKDQLKKSIVGCGVVLDGKLPIYEPMIL